MVLNKTLDNPLDCKEIKPVNPKGNQPWIFIGRTEAEVEVPVLWPPNVKSRLTGKGRDDEKDWRQKEKGVAEDEMVGYNHWLNEHEFEQLWEIVEDRVAWYATVHAVKELDMMTMGWIVSS